jgi:hypothetical protein
MPILSFWHVYVLAGAYFVWPWAPSRTIRDVTRGPLSATDTYIVYHVTHFEASRNVIFHTRYVSKYVGAGCGRGRGTKKTKAIRCGACYYSIVFTRISCTLLTCDMYMSDLRHIHDPVLSSLKVEGIRLLVFLWHCDPTRVMASSFLRFLNLTQRRTTVGRTPLDEWSARCRDLYLTTHNTHNKHPDSNPRSQQASGHRLAP